MGNDSQAIEAMVYEYHDAVTTPDIERLDKLCADSFTVKYMGDYAFTDEMPKAQFLQMTPMLYQRMSSVTHFVTNLQTSSSGDTATASYLMLAVHMFSGDGFEERADSGGKVELDFARAGDGWVISEQRVYGGFRDPRYQGLLMGQLEPLPPLSE